jgi:hypothetical protein
MGRNDLTALIKPTALALKGRVAGPPRRFEARELLRDPLPQVLRNAWTGIRHGDLQVVWSFKTRRLPRRYADDDLAPLLGIAEPWVLRCGCSGAPLFVKCTLSPTQDVVYCLASCASRSYGELVMRVADGTPAAAVRRRTPAWER